MLYVSPSLFYGHRTPCKNIQGHIKEVLPGGKFCIFVSNGGIEMKTTLDWADKHLSKEAKVKMVLDNFSKQRGL